MKNNKITHKIVLLGKSGAGKTALVSRWINGSYDASKMTTIGANALSKDIDLNGETVTIVIWDTAGQEKFQALSPHYIKNSASAIIVADITDLESLNDIENWINRLNMHSERIPPAVLAINKIDKTEPHALSDDEIETRFSSSFQGIFFVSALTNEGVDDLFMEASIAAHEFDSNIVSRTEIVHLRDASTQNKCSC